MNLGWASIQGFAMTNNVSMDLLFYDEELQPQTI